MAEHKIPDPDAPGERDASPAPAENVAGLRLVLPDLFGPEQDFSQMDWRPFRPGIEIARLYGGGDDAASAALLRYAPGAQLQSHEHTAHEHIIVLQGSQRDERQEYGAGTCLIHGAGTRHRVSSDHGCVVLAIWHRPVAFTST